MFSEQVKNHKKIAKSLKISRTVIAIGDSKNLLKSKRGPFSSLLEASSYD
jgi:hypothetical protein